MNNRIKTLLTIILFSALSANAQLQECSLNDSDEILSTEDREITESWWGYFDGDYNSISVTGIDSEVPVNYSCAIKIEAGNPDLLGKRIKAIKFAFEKIDLIENVSVWVSKELPNKPSDADVFYIPLDKSDVKSYEKDNTENIVSFPQPYQVGGIDVYVGYSFKVTPKEGENTDPIVVSYATTKENAFLLNWGSGWMDNAGRNYGNLAIMLLTDDGGEFQTGDANYDSDINVLDVSNVLQYILTGNVFPFNKKGADTDGNGDINIVDVESIIDMILERYEDSVNKKTEDCDGEVIAVKDNGCIGVSLISDHAYRGFQMDLVFPEDADVKSIEANNNVALTHTLRYTRTAGGRYRVIASSLNGTELSINSEQLFNIIADTDDIKIENIIFATSDLHEKRFKNVSLTDVAGITGVKSEKNNDVIYNVYGVKVNGNTNDIKKGIYIIDGNKVVIK